MIFIGPPERSPSAPSYTDELCDGIDNDGDGATDEDFFIGEPCEKKRWSCVTKGAYECNGLHASLCNAPEPPWKVGPEICDGEDNNCDSFVDNIDLTPLVMRDVSGLDRVIEDFGFSPDGSKIVFFESGNSKIFFNISDLQGNTIKDFPVEIFGGDPNKNVFQVRWTLSDEILFCVDNGIYTISTDGSHLNRLPLYPSSCLFLEQIGEKIVYDCTVPTCPDLEPNAVCIADKNGADKHNIIDTTPFTPFYTVRPLVVSPDEENLYFSVNNMRRSSYCDPNRSSNALAVPAESIIYQYSPFTDALTEIVRLQPEPNEAKDIFVQGLSVSPVDETLLITAGYGARDACYQWSDGRLTSLISSFQYGQCFWSADSSFVYVELGSQWWGIKDSQWTQNFSLGPYSPDYLIDPTGLNYLSAHSDDNLLYPFKKVIRYPFPCALRSGAAPYYQQEREE